MEIPHNTPYSTVAGLAGTAHPVVVIDAVVSGRAAWSHLCHSATTGCWGLLGAAGGADRQAPGNRRNHWTCPVRERVSETCRLTLPVHALNPFGCLQPLYPTTHHKPPLPLLFLSSLSLVSYPFPIAVGCAVTSSPHRPSRVTVQDASIWFIVKLRHRLSGYDVHLNRNYH